MSATAHTEQADLPSAQNLAADITWYGPSGELVSGREVAQHLEATIALLNEHGWSRTHIFDEPDTEPDALTGANESWTVKRLLLALIRFASDSEKLVSHPLTLDKALHAITRTKDGDLDSWDAAMRCLEAVLRTRTGVRFPNLTAWSEKRSRTHEDIRGLLQEAAGFARQYGPVA